MDEFSKLKQAWNSSFGGTPESLDKERVAQIMRSRTAGPLARLKKRLRLEIAATVIAIPFLVWVLFALPGPYFIFNTSALILLFTGMLYYYFMNLRKVVKLWNNSQDNLRQSLESTLILFRFFRKAYFRLNMVLFPFGVYFGYIIGFGLGSGGDKVSSFLFVVSWPLVANVILWVVIFALIITGFWAILKVYVKQYYDKHIQNLEILLEELLENEPGAENEPQATE